MKFIGITGGVGAGKSQILSYLAKKPDTEVMLADEIAHTLMQPGTQCYERIIEAFGAGICLPEGGFDRQKLAELIFSREEKRKQMNGIVHPAVKEYVKKRAERERERGALKLLVLEAALLIEEHYDEICDELWYIYTREDVRRERLIKDRGYSEEKIRQIFGSQLGEAEYRSACVAVIDNNGTIEDTLRRIDRILEGDGAGQEKHR